MRLSLIVNFLVAAAAAASSDTDKADTTPDKLVFKDGVAIVKPLKSYVAKLECVGCPFVSWDSQSNATSVDPKRDNVLLLEVDIDDDGANLLLNKDSIIPLGAIPPPIKAAQVPKDLLIDSNDKAGWGSLVNSALQYEHSILKTKMPNRWWIQFDVTALTFGHVVQPVKMDKQGQRLVQILVARKDHRSAELSIETVEVVERKDRVQPFKMRCGKLAISTTKYDPNEWDQYGKLGTWTRTWNLVLTVLGDGLADGVEKFLILAPLAVMIALSLVLRRRWLLAQALERTARDEEAEFALLTSWDDEDLPPAYTNVPVIKIEEYD